MKKNTFKLGLLSLGLIASPLAACGSSSPTIYIVTFKQNNQQDIVFKVTAGNSLEEVPSPADKTGYTVTWDRSDFTNIQEDITVNAVEVANTYVVTYSANGFAIDGTTIEFTYDSVCAGLDMSLTKTEETLLGWKYNDTVYTNTSVWNIANDVTLTAEWGPKRQVTVTFRYSDGTKVEKKVFEGQDLTDIPEVNSKTGYTVSWDRTDFTNLTEDILVNVIETPKTYVVTLDANGGSVSENSFTVTFDRPYSLPKAVSDDYFFSTWKYNERNIPLNGTWDIDAEDGSVTLVAEWGDSLWTDIL